MQFMKDFYTKKIGRKTLIAAVLFSIIIILVSLTVYLNKIEKSIKEEIILINKVEQKINQVYEVKKKLESITLPEGNGEIFIARFIDGVKMKFPDVNIEISNIKKENREFGFTMTVKGEVLWSRFVDILNFLEQTDYPFIFVKSLSLNPKEERINFDIKTDVKLLSVQYEKRI